MISERSIKAYSKASRMTWASALARNAPAIRKTREVSATPHLVAGNPVSTRLESGIGNCFPGLECDLRNLERRFFPFLETDVIGNTITLVSVDMKGVKAARKKKGVIDDANYRAYRALSSGGHWTVETIGGTFGPLGTLKFALAKLRGVSSTGAGRLPINAWTAVRLLTEGTKTRTSKQIAEQIDSMGASLSASAGFGSGSAVVAASGLSDTFEQWFALTTDVLLHPNFPADELAQYQSRAKSALLQQRSQPGFLANQTMSHTLYGKYPAAVVSATPESLDALTPAMLADWHDKHYAPQNTILAISGDVHADTLIPKLKQWLAEWQKSKLHVDFPAGPPPARRPTLSSCCA
jgi:hypothetical protein